MTEKRTMCTLERISSMCYRYFCLSLLMVSPVILQGQSPTDGTTTVGAYGELHYNEPDGTPPGQLDFHRFVIYLSHTFDDHISFISEVELEHTVIEAGESEGGELSIEQAFLDYRLFDSFGFRAGILLTPVGLVNLYHEPPVFNGVERPMVDQVIIPTTWREAGAGIYGTAGEISYQVSVVAGLDASGFNASTGLRGGRQEAFRSNPVNPSATGRVSFAPFGGFLLGASFFVGGAAAGNDSIGSPVAGLWSADARYDAGPFSFRTVGAIGTIHGAEEINAEFNQHVADRIYGFYAEGAWNMLPFLFPDSDQSLVLFARYEKYNTQAQTTGFSPLLQFNRNDFVFGLTYKPTYNTVFKLDYVFMNNALNDSLHPNTQQLNAGIGYSFN